MMRGLDGLPSAEIKDVRVLVELLDFRNVPIGDVLLSAAAGDPLAFNGAVREDGGHSLKTPPPINTGV